MAVQVGDVFEYRGRRYQVEKVDPYLGVEAKDLGIVRPVLRWFDLDDFIRLVSAGAVQFEK